MFNVIFGFYVLKFIFIGYYAEINKMLMLRALLSREVMIRKT
jgi:hypothetical protein